MLRILAVCFSSENIVELNWFSSLINCAGLKNIWKINKRLCQTKKLLIRPACRDWWRQTPKWNWQIQFNSRIKHQSFHYSIESVMGSANELWTHSVCREIVSASMICVYRKLPSVCQSGNEDFTLPTYDQIMTQTWIVDTYLNECEK